MIRLIGAGFGRTGTLSLKHALEALGLDKCYHMAEVLKNPQHIPIWQAAHNGEAIDWQALFNGYQASVDWPSCNLWREQLAAFPDAKVILSLRDKDRWYDSVMETIYAFSTAGLSSDDPQRRAGARWAHEVIWQRVFDGKMDDRAHVTGVFEKLVFEAAQGWQPLCEFLDLPVPAEPYPRVNSREEFGTVPLE